MHSKTTATPLFTIPWLKSQLGENVFDALVAGFGGTSLFIPATPRETSPLVRLLGTEDAAKVCAAIGGWRFNVPMNAAGTRRNRDKQILALKKQGWSAIKIARHLQVHERTVRRVTAAHRRNSRRMSADPTVAAGAIAPGRHS